MTRLDWLWLLVVGVASSAWCVTAARELGPTFDEPFYVAQGLESWRSGSNRAFMRAGTMPLPVDVQTLPLYWWERIRGVPFEPYSELPKLLPVARAMNLLFWWAMLWYVGGLGRLWGGAWAGRLAVGVVGFEPNLLAHAALATTDIALTAAVLAAVYHFAAGQGGPWWKRVLVPGLAFGLALACKASAITFVPLAWAVLLVNRRREPPGGIQNPRVDTRGSPIRDLASAGLLAAVVLFAYCGSDWVVEPSFVRWAEALPDGPVADAMRTTASHLRIFPNAAEGIVQQVKHNARGHGCYVLGEWHPRAVWYYFPVVLPAKLAEPFLLTLAAVLLLRPKGVWNPAGAVALAYLLFSLTCRVQIGVRLVFPLVVMAHLALAVAIGRDANVKRRVALPVLLLLGTLVVSLLAWPHGLRYLNQFWGGQTRAAAVLTDSNCDWGQGLPELARWHAANGEPTLHVWYYGTDPAILLPPFRVFQVNQLPEPNVAAVKRRVGSGYFAVGVSLLTGCPDRRPGALEVVEWLNGMTPIATVGTFRVFKLE